MVYLIHSGTPGMKWGRRNYQYEDGTWTPEGKKRRREEYAASKSGFFRRIFGKSKSEEKMADKAAEQKPDLTPEQKKKLQDAYSEYMRNEVQKMSLEKQYRQLKAEEAKLAQGKDFWEKAEEFNKKFTVVNNILNNINNFGKNTGLYDTISEYTKPYIDKFKGKNEKKGKK